MNLPPAEAIAPRQTPRHQVIERDELGEVRHVAGVDVGFEDGGRDPPARRAAIRE